MVSCVHIQESPVAIQTPERDRQQYDRPADCVIAEQYFPATFISLRFPCVTEKLGLRFSYVNISVLFTFLRTAEGT